MKKIVIIASALLVFATPYIASAHQTATYKIGNSTYQIVIGSMNEPIIVDDKTGLDLTVSKCPTSACNPTVGADGDMDGPAGTPVTGLEESLKLELIAGNQRRILPIAPAYGAEGSYRAPFFLTVPTTVSYRLFGEINGTAVDLGFTCLPPGMSHGEKEVKSVKISDGVTQLSNAGGFGCPAPKNGYGFPEPAVPLLAVNAGAASARSTANFALVLSVVSLVAVVIAYRKKQ